VIDYAPLEAWFVTGSQHLYGPEALERGIIAAWDPDYRERLGLGD